ncbi:MAG: hypothetical protein IJN83_03985, partial [Clostridia bacterium]|nr:hypothetical protein [Clostridia bacterium]
KYGALPLKKLKRHGPYAIFADTGHVLLYKAGIYPCCLPGAGVAVVHGGVSSCLVDISGLIICYVWKDVNDTEVGKSVGNHKNIVKIQTEWTLI